MSLCNGVIVRLLQLLEITCMSILILIKGFINKVSESVFKGLIDRHIDYLKPT